MQRREFLGLAAGTLLVGCDDRGAANLPKPPAATTGPDGKRRLPWQNWSGYQHGLPAERLAPESLDALVEAMRAAPGPIRPVGAGHSFTPLVPADGGTLLSLRNFEGVLAHDAGTLTATVGGGTRLADLGEPLERIGQALPNMPDIDKQTLAGAIATATHGTGASLGAMHSYVTALQLVTPRGEVIDCSRERRPDVFAAALVSVGSLGVITQCTLQNVPAHRLKRRVWMEPLDSMLERFDELVAKHHSFEFYVVPSSDHAVVYAIDPTDEPVRPRDDVASDNESVRLLKAGRDWLSWAPRLRRWVTNTADEYVSAAAEAVDASWRIFPSEREVRFNEMEYHLPREHLLPTLRKVRETLDQRHPEIFFPIEVRVVRGVGDGALLSPFQGHAVSGSIAVHHSHVEDPLPYFADIEPLFREASGRPHWGKMNTLGAADFAALYPRWQEFLDVRAALDPEGKMLNPYLRKVFGL